MNFTRHEHALRTIELLNNNQQIFGPQRRPIIQFAIENRRALQLQEQRRERIHAKQELLKDPTKKILSFDAQNNKEKKKTRQNVFDPQAKKPRLSELIRQVAEEVEEMETNNDGEIDETHSHRHENGVRQRPLKKKRVKSKSKGEIRDKVDRMIAKTRNKLPLPSRTKTKWFE